MEQRMFECGLCKKNFPCQDFEQEFCEVCIEKVIYGARLIESNSCKKIEEKSFNEKEIERFQKDCDESLQSGIQQVAEGKTKDRGSFAKYVENEKEKRDVDHPQHYQGKGLEAIDVIERFDLNFNLGNSIKYILRADKKGCKKKDLQKAIWYLNNEIYKIL